MATLSGPSTMLGAVDLIHFNPEAILAINFGLQEFIQFLLLLIKMLMDYLAESHLMA
jgi:hypothetical protein